MQTLDYEELVADALTAPVEGWDFSRLRGRAVGSEPSWSYSDLARAHLDRSERVLDIETGGGEVLAALLGPRRAEVWATEGWPANIPLARRRLEPLGVTVLAAPEDDGLPVPDSSIDLVLNRHGRLPADEVARVLRPGGVLLTQQVGSEDCADLNERLGAPPADSPDSWNLDVAGDTLIEAGLRLKDLREEHPVLTFYDIGALIYHLRLVSWQIPDFSVQRYDAALRRLHAKICAEGRLDVHAHRFLIEAERR